MSKRFLPGLRLHPRLRNVFAAVCAAALVVTSSSSAGAITTAPVAGGPQGAGACAAQALAAGTRGTVAPFRAFGDCEIARRQATLSALISAVDGSSTLTAADRAALTTQIDGASSGLAALGTTIDAQTRLPALKLEIVQIDTRWRVYLLDAPKVYLVAAADGVLALQTSFAQAAADLADQIATAQSEGKNVTAATAGLASMNAEVGAAMSLAAPLPEQLLGLTVAQLSAGTAGPALSAARAALISARVHLQAAVKYGRAVIVALQ